MSIVLQFHISFIMTVYHKMWQILLQNATAILLQNMTEVYYKLRRFFLWNVTVLLQNTIVITNRNDFITKCNSYYKMQHLLQIPAVHGSIKEDHYVELSACWAFLDMVRGNTWHIVHTLRWNSVRYPGCDIELHRLHIEAHFTKYASGESCKCNIEIISSLPSVLLVLKSRKSKWKITFGHWTATLPNGKVSVFEKQLLYCHMYFYQCCGKRTKCSC